MGGWSAVCVEKLYFLLEDLPWRFRGALVVGETLESKVLESLKFVNQDLRQKSGIPEHT